MPAARREHGAIPASGAPARAPRVTGVRAFAAAALLSLLAACGSGAPAGTACTRPSDCQSGLCLSRTGGATCAQRCQSSADCAGGDVCGRFDFRTVDGDSGTHTGMDSDVVHVCRPPLNATCSASADCTGGASVCATNPSGTAGVCTAPCTANASCPSGLCLPSSTTACGFGQCAPPCDDIRECPQQWYCDQSLVDTYGHGRCVPLVGDDAGAPIDAACGVDASSSGG